MYHICIYNCKFFLTHQNPYKNHFCELMDPRPPILAAWCKNLGSNYGILSEATNKQGQSHCEKPWEMEKAETF